MKAYVEVSNAGHIRDRDRLIAKHMDVARRIALRVARRVPDWLSVDDLIAAGMIGLAEAADRYDTTRQEPFIAFAEKRIRGAVLDELRRGDIMPRRVRNTARTIGTAIRQLEQRLGRPPEDEEVAAELGVNVNQYREELSVLTHVAIVDLETPETQPNVHRAPDDCSPALRAERAEILRMVREALEFLPERDALILSLYYNEEFTYSEIGELLGVSESRVCQLHSRAITRLRAQIENPGERG